jgi:hypothetical protein
MTCPTRWKERKTTKSPRTPSSQADILCFVILALSWWLGGDSEVSYGTHPPRPHAVGQLIDLPAATAGSDQGLQRVADNACRLPPPRRSRLGECLPTTRLRRACLDAPDLLSMKRLGQNQG